MLVGRPNAAAGSRAPEPALRPHKEVFYEAFLHANDPIEVTDRHGVIVDVNPAFERTYGYARTECIGKTPGIVRSPHTPRSLYEELWRDITDTAKGRWSGELVNLDKAGRPHEVRLSIDAVRDKSGTITHFIGVAADLDERRKWEHRAGHTERLAAIGQLAAGLAHELNTPLASILLIAEQVRSRAEDSSTRDLLDTLAGEVDAASRIVRGLLDFAREPTHSMGRVDLVEVLREAVRFLRGKHPEGVHVTEEYEEPSIAVRGDRDELHQLFVNLVKNSYEALAGRGHVRVSLRRDGATVEATVADDGPGIPVDLQPRLFEPFFTTKPPGQGTGLGLAICYGIATRHGGEIRVRSGAGDGAAFTVLLPGAPPEAGP